MNRTFAERTVVCPPPFSQTLEVANPYAGAASVVWVLSRGTVGPGCPTGIASAIASMVRVAPPAPLTYAVYTPAQIPAPRARRPAPRPATLAVPRALKLGLTLLGFFLTLVTALAIVAASDDDRPAAPVVAIQEHLAARLR